MQQAGYSVVHLLKSLYLIALAAAGWYGWQTSKPTYLLKSLFPIFLLGLLFIVWYIVPIWILATNLGIKIQNYVSVKEHFSKKRNKT